MAQQIAYYCCDVCDSTWSTGWAEHYAIKNMRDYCAVCQTTPEHAETCISTPIYVKGSCREEHSNKGV